MKHCSKCHIYKDKEDFTHSVHSKDGLNSWCKLCTRANTRNGYNLNRKLRKQQTAAYQKTPKGKEVSKNSVNKWIALNPKKYLAHLAVHAALRRGVITIQLCRDCGEKKVQAHHPDYDRPYDVIWLCPQHHKDEHAKSLTQVVEKRQHKPLVIPMN